MSDMYTLQGRVAAEKIHALSGNLNVYVRHLDLSSLSSIRAFSKEFREDFQELHLLINNAGVAGDVGHKLYGVGAASRLAILFYFNYKHFRQEFQFVPFTMGICFVDMTRLMDLN